MTTRDALPANRKPKRNDHDHGASLVQSSRLRSGVARAAASAPITWLYNACSPSARTSAGVRSSQIFRSSAAAPTTSPPSSWNSSPRSARLYPGPLQKFP